MKKPPVFTWKRKDGMAQLSVLIVEAIKFQNAKIISRCLIDAKNAENISLLELEQF